MAGYWPRSLFIGDYWDGKAAKVHKGPVIRAIFFFNLCCNIVALQVETLCCAYYHLRDQLVSQQNILLQICGILRV